MARTTNSTKDPESLAFQTATDFCSAVNNNLETERSAYRLVDFHLVPITNETEIEAVNTAATSRSGFENVAAHIHAAIALFSNKKSPDYRNCIKEAISAVEAAARTVAQSDRATLGDALKELEKAKKIHGFEGWISQDLWLFK